jgi:hypothetical protein
MIVINKVGNVISELLRKRLVEIPAVGFLYLDYPVDLVQCKSRTQDATATHVRWGKAMGKDRKGGSTGDRLNHRT